eukprot:NODE_358_length_1818_cov_326.853590_g263_i0.p6 GENE.NODE_358_length_1818_cov_326.853590_g263_i0~~NODE_358_length_1818_cov_326.853590_g263_i0.p6  ORF type:complete len:97 (+),score=20.65 NODE_358_length_1818_cov_326.853590_g263_i0:458-748(+)
MSVLKGMLKGWRAQGGHLKTTLLVGNARVVWSAQDHPLRYNCAVGAKQDRDILLDNFFSMCVCCVCVGVLCNVTGSFMVQSQGWLQGCRRARKRSC